MCVAWKDGDWTSAGCTRGDNGPDAPTYSTTECRCSFLSTAYATLYEWPAPFVPPVVAPEPSPVVATNGAPSDSDDPFMETDQIVLLVIFVVVCLVVALVLAKRTHYNHKKQFLAATSERELALWNKERGNDLYHVRRHSHRTGTEVARLVALTAIPRAPQVPHQPDPAPRPTEPAAGELQPTTSRRSDKYSSQEQSDDNTPARQHSASDSDDSRRSGYALHTSSYVVLLTDEMTHRRRAAGRHAIEVSA